MTAIRCRGEKIIAEQHNVFKKHPKTKFINAHLGWYGNDLKKLGELLDQYPNMYTEIGAVIAELGRQPRAAKAFLTRYQDRVLFGKDSWVPEEYPTYFRVLEQPMNTFPTTSVTTPSGECMAWSYRMRY